MRFSNLFFNNSHFERDNSKLDLVGLMQKACLFHQDSSGIYSMLTLGLKLERCITTQVEREMDALGFSQVRLSLLQDRQLWSATNRIESYGDELFTLKNRKGQAFCLSATAEESITSLYADYYNRQRASMHVYQVGNKYRDEMRARAGLIRGKEFVMKDGYSFASDKEALLMTYEQVKEAYLRIFNYFSLNVQVKTTDNAQMGGSFSEEFLVKSANADSDDGWLEVGHIFMLGDTYSKAFKLKDHKNEHVHMACYGIGISRLLMAILEKHRDAYGFHGSRNFHTYDCVISALDMQRNREVAARAEFLYAELRQRGVDVLLDDRDISAGKKLSDAEMLGARARVVVSQQALDKGCLEWMDRKSMTKCELLFDGASAHMSLNVDQVLDMLRGA